MVTKPIGNHNAGKGRLVKDFYTAPLKRGFECLEFFIIEELEMH